MQKPKIKITVIGRKGPCGCHRGHKPGDSFDFDTERGQSCAQWRACGFPYIDILRYGGSNSRCRTRHGSICCPDVDTINVFKVEVVKDE